MNYYRAKIINAIIKTSEDAPVQSQAFCSQPTQEDEKKFGKIFGFVHIESHDPKIEKFIGLISRELQDTYYQTGENIKKTSGILELERRLEYALQKTNTAIAAYLQKEKMLLNLKRVNIFIGAIKEKNICFTAIGDVCSYLIHHRKKDDYAMINIYEKHAGSSSEINPLRFFTQTISGRIENHDFIFFGTENILDYLSLEKIKSTAIFHSPADAVRVIETMLHSIRVPNHFVFSLMRIELIEVPQSTLIEMARKEEEKSAAFQESMARLNSSEKNTEKFLNPSVGTTVKKLVRSFQDTVVSYTAKFKDGTLSRLSARKTQRTGYSRARVPAPRLPENTSAVRGPHGRGDTASFQKLFQSVLRFFGKTIRRLWTSFSKLPPKTKIITVVIAVLCVFLVQSIVALSISRQKEKTSEKFESIILNIQRMKDAADASLIYQDEEAARRKIISAKNFFSDIPDEFKDNPAVTSLQKEIENRLNELQHLVALPNPISLGNWKNLDPEAVISPNIALTNDIFYTQKRNNGQIYKLNKNSRVLSSVFSPIDNIGDITNSTVINGEIIAYDTNQTFYSINTEDDSIAPITVNLEENADIRAIANYNGRVYLMDTRNSQIFRYTKTVNGMARGEAWISEAGIDLSSAIDMAIDGSIYVLMSDGSIIKLTQGKREEFSHEIIDPPITEPTAFFTSVNTENIYILEPKNSRMVIIDKNGSLISQYSSDSFLDTKDFIAIESDNAIYLLRDTAIYGISLQPNGDGAL